MAAEEERVKVRRLRDVDVLPVIPSVETGVH